MCEIVDRIRQEGKKEGKAEGKIEGKIEDILELLAELGKIPAKLMRQISQEKDLNILGRWLRCAASATSISEFEIKMKGLSH